MSVALALLAMLIEAAIGYPDRLVRAIGHPVIWIGRLISALERRLNRPAFGRANRAVGEPTLQPSPASGGGSGAERRGRGMVDGRVKPGDDEMTADGDEIDRPAFHTSPLEGEVGWRSYPGGGCVGDGSGGTPLPDPPQGGRERSAFADAKEGRAASRVPGIIALLILLTVVGGVSLAVECALLLVPFGAIPLGVIASSLIAQRSLHHHVARVAAALETGGLEAGRDAVSQIVGRDPASLDEAGVARAAIESLAENFSDGVVAPVFWLALGGLPGAALYKAVNTADSMIGHRTPRYQHFGWAAARLDDLLNLPAARFSALLLIAAAAMTSRQAAAQAWSAVRRDAARHRSPNAGYPEAAMAGALGLKLAGPRIYSGVRVDDAFMGDGRREATAADVRTALALYRRADALLIALLAFVAVALIAIA